MNKLSHQDKLNRRTRQGVLAGAVVGLLLLTAACGGGKPADPVTYYSFAYSSPRYQGKAPLNLVLKVRRFSASQTFNSLSMLYGPSDLEFSAYNYHQWRVNPGDLVSDFLVRDLRDSGLFKAVFSYRDSQTGRFSLEGGVERFLELDAKDGSKAVLSLNATLLDLSQGLVSRRVVFQRWYRAEAPLAQANARALAKGMSRAMAEISGRLINDVYRAMAAADPISKQP